MYVKEFAKDLDKHLETVSRLVSRAAMRRVALIAPIRRMLSEGMGRG
jgi:hypothetical protein